MKNPPLWSGLFSERSDFPRTYTVVIATDVNRITVYTKFQLLICLLRCRALYLVTSQRVKRVGWRSFQVYNRDIVPIST